MSPAWKFLGRNMRNEREKGMYILCKLGGANNISTFTTILLAKWMNEYMREIPRRSKWELSWPWKRNRSCGKNGTLYKYVRTASRDFLWFAVFSSFTTYYIYASSRGVVNRYLSLRCCCRFISPSPERRSWRGREGGMGEDLTWWWVCGWVGNWELGIVKESNGDGFELSWVISRRRLD